MYVAAFQPEAGESTGALNALYPGSKLGPDTTAVIEYPGGSDLYLKPSAFAGVYAADVPPETAALMAATQRPVAVAALGEAFEGPAAWHAIPSWALIATEDHSLPTEAQRFMASRANSKITEVASSHAVPVSRPDAVSPDADPRELASVVVGTLEGALMLSKLCDDGAHMGRAVAHLKRHLRALARSDEG